jgi:hypothetical protein
MAETLVLSPFSPFSPKTKWLLGLSPCMIPHMCFQAGAPGTGKSTLCENLADSLASQAFAEGDITLWEKGEVLLAEGYTSAESHCGFASDCDLDKLKRTVRLPGRASLKVPHFYFTFQVRHLSRTYVVYSVAVIHLHQP